MSLKDQNPLFSLFPQTPSVTSTLDFIKKYLDEPTYNHVVRSALFSCILIRNLSAQNEDKADSTASGSAGYRQLTPVDTEVVVVASLLHDMAWNPTLASTKEFVSDDKRFEVDGANAARSFLTTLPEEHGWGHTEQDQRSIANNRRTQLVWDAIALHSTLSLAWHKEPEVVLSNFGIVMDVFKNPDHPLPDIPESCRVSRHEFDDIYSSFPSMQLASYLRDAFCALCREKPQTTYDNMVGQYGTEYVEGYDVKAAWIPGMLKLREQAEAE